MFFYQMLHDGGPVMWLIAVGAVVSLVIFLAKTFQFHREEINVRELLRGLTNVLQRDGIVEALTLCDNTPGPVARLLSAAILAYERGDENIRQAVDDAALDELPKLERHLNFIGTMGLVMPLLGLLGTILGLLGMFEVIRNGGTIDVVSAAKPLGQALISTAAGLTVAIPCYLGYNYLVARVNAISLDMEKAALEISGFFDRKLAEKKADE